MKNLTFILYTQEYSNPGSINAAWVVIASPKVQMTTLKAEFALAHPEQAQTWSDESFSVQPEPFLQFLRDKGFRVYPVDEMVKLDEERDWEVRKQTEDVTKRDQVVDFLFEGYEITERRAKDLVKKHEQMLTTRFGAKALADRIARQHKLIVLEG